jgi:LysM repeat protein
MVKFTAAFVFASVALLASASVLPRVPNGTQFITGPCATDFECASDCCAFNTGKCAGAVIAQSRDGGCGHGDPFPNNRAAQVIQGPNAERAPGVPVGPQAPSKPSGGGGGGGGAAGTVTVKAGDTCSAIAASRGTTAAAIIAANPGVNAGCTNLQIGQTLNVSGGGGGGGAAPAPAPAPAPSNGGSGKPPGTQFITGPCGGDADCNSGCCGFRTGKCAGAIIAQERDGGCGFGNPTPNNEAAKKIAGPNAEKAPGVPRI